MIADLVENAWRQSSEASTEGDPCGRRRRRRGIVQTVLAGHGALLDCIAELAIIKHAAVGSSAALRKRRGAEGEGLCMTGGP